MTTATHTTTGTDLLDAINRLRAALNEHRGRPTKYQSGWPGWHAANSLLQTMRQTFHLEQPTPREEAVYVARIEQELVALRRAKNPAAGAKPRTMQQITGYEPASTYDPSNPWAMLDD